jgi:hypothetical protein
MNGAADAEMVVIPWRRFSPGAMAELSECRDDSPMMSARIAAARWV